jgi:hypothetical protein
MAWTAPATWSVSELVTASKMNTHVRDNLTYLKGGAGTIAFDAAATFVATSGTILSASASGGSATVQVTASNSAGNNAQLSLTNTGQRNALIYLDRANDKLRISQNGTINPAINIDSNGNVGLSATTTPKGILHGYDSISGLLKYEFDNVDGTARTIIPNGAGDVISQLGGIYVTACNDGTTKTGALPSGSALTPGGVGFSIGENSGATQLCKLTVAADGSIAVQRTTGASATWDVALWLIWI